MFDLKKQLLWSKLKVGLVITLALLTLFLTVFFAGGIETLFSPRVELKAQIQDVKGLRRGAPVWLSGIEIGSVKNIHLHPERGTIVILSINKKAMQFIRKDAQASVLTMGLLGDKYVEISAGTPEAGSIREGEEIKGVSQIELKDVMATSAMSIERLSEFIKKLDSLVTKIETGEGTIARFISDPSLYDNLKEASKTLSLTVKDIREARGSLKLLVEDPSLYNRLLAASSSLDEFGRRLNEGSGTIRRIVDDPAVYNNLLSASSSLEEFTRKLNDSSGTLRRLAEDPTLYDNLSKASGQLSLILERIERGEGVAGTLLKDKELAAELKGIISEIKELARDIREHPKRYFKFSIF